MKRLFYTVIAFYSFVSFTFKAQATTHIVTSLAELTTALSSAAENDTISFLANITVTSTLNISKGLVFNGNGYTITVPVTGINDAGVFNTSPSTFRVFDLNASAKTIIFNHLTIKGGATTTDGGAVNIFVNTTAKFNYCTISNSKGKASGGGGGGINNAGNCYLKNSKIKRSAGGYGGGFINIGNMYLEDSEVTDNRSLCANCGGGGGTNNSGTSKLYVNNCIFSNNNSSELGGAFNNYQGYAYFLNTSFTGNVVYGTYKGGAIAQNSTHPMYIINCLFSYNYYETNLNAPTNPPTAYTIDDIHAFNGAVNMYYCVYTAKSTQGGGSITEVVGNTSHALANDGSDNDILTGGLYSTINNENGAPFGSAQVFRPFLVNISGVKAPTLKTSSFAIGKGCVTGYTDGGGTPIIGFEDASSLPATWVDIEGSGASSYQVSTDLLNNTRATVPVVGAIEEEVDNYATFKVNANTNGTVSGGSIYGDVYPSGTSVSVTALADNGYTISDWTYVLGGSGTISGNPLSLTLNENTEITPNFVSTSNVFITYIGNNNSGGTPPAVETYSSGATATISSNSGTLTKSGFTFDGWNTSENGSGVAYAESASTTITANINLYANWSSNGEILPVELTDFSVRLVNKNNVSLSWETASEVNNDFFEVQRSKDAIRWEMVDIIKGAGTSTSKQMYSTVDTRPYEGESYYRLKQVDLNGAFQLSEIKQIDIKNAAADLHVFPNPATDIITLVANDVDINEILIVNSLGQIINNIVIEKTGQDQARINSKNLLPGIYFLKYLDTSKVISIQ